MFGLGSTIGKDYNREHLLLAEYKSDFTSTSSGFLHFDDSGTTNAFAAGQTIGGFSDWLRVTNNTNEADNSGIRHSSALNVASQTGESEATGDFAIVSYMIYIYHDGSTDHWGGTDAVSHYIKVHSDQQAAREIELNTITRVNVITSGHGDSSYSDKLIFGFDTAGDLPQDGAVYYIRDIHSRILRKKYT